MINNKCMKQFILSILIIFISASGAFATSMFPDTVQTGPAVIRTNSREVTDYNVALRNKLEDDFHKKYTKKVNDNYYIDTSPLGAYGREVLRPYALQKKPDNYKIIKK